MQSASPTLTPGATVAPWYRHRWPWLLMAGPAIVVVAGLSTVWLAVVRGDALVADDYYKQGKAINKDLRRDREAWRLGAQIALSYDPAARLLRGRVQMKQMPAAGEQGRTLFLSLVHPTQPAKDRALIAQAAADGSFAVPVDELEQARWRLVAEDGSRAWRLHGSWSWPQQRQVEMSAEAYAPAE
ncbi:FixH family protein [Herbaspirillum robiniae]|uniref:FixH family protein n=1 Tax=Herbaspirillum robiniae TaxID=2014887 RepID=A0ABX2LY94_9BURK|nr:FixH family protein [Herbaspirillum robiniae]NUU00976.1 FixH family protein [Herbaspirillum robiniae]